jgi:hypothetical protein
MVLTTLERQELMAKARAAKANKRAVIKDEPDDEPEPEPEPEKVKKTRQKKAEVPLPVPVEVINEPEEPVVAPKKKALPVKWLKAPKTEPVKVCCDEKVSKEEYVIDDDKPQVAAERIVVPARKEIVKKRAPRASAPERTLDITEPEPIEEVLEDIRYTNAKYLPKVRQATPAPAPAPAPAPIQIKKANPPFSLFNY